MNTEVKNTDNNEIIDKNENISNHNSFKNIILVLAIVVIGFILDQITKIKICEPLKGNNPIVLIKNVLEFTYVENRGAAFGILNGQKTVFLIIAIVFSAIMIYIFYKLPAERKYLDLNICLAFTLSGAIGNSFDRISIGYVRDFIYFRLIDFPVFNVADIFITCSMFWLMGLILFKYKDEDFYFLKKNKTTNKDTEEN